jgi:hypothetical protein
MRSTASLSAIARSSSWRRARVAAVAVAAAVAPDADADVNAEAAAAGAGGEGAAPMERVPAIASKGSMWPQSRLSPRRTARLPAAGHAAPPASSPARAAAGSGAPAGGDSALVRTTRLV